MRKKEQLGDGSSYGSKIDVGNKGLSQIRSGGNQENRTQYEIIIRVSSKSVVEKVRNIEKFWLWYTVVPFTGIGNLGGSQVWTLRQCDYYS